MTDRKAGSSIRSRACNDLLVSLRPTRLAKELRIARRNDLLDRNPNVCKGLMDCIAHRSNTPSPCTPQGWTKAYE